MNELEYGPVLILKEIHKGKLGLFDDEQPYRVKSAIVYLFGGECVLINPEYLTNLDGIDLFDITMGESLKRIR